MFIILRLRQYINVPTANAFLVRYYYLDVSYLTFHRDLGGDYLAPGDQCCPSLIHSLTRPLTVKTKFKCTRPSESLQDCTMKAIVLVRIRWINCSWWQWRKWKWNSKEKIRVTPNCVIRGRAFEACLENCLYNSLKDIAAVWPYLPCDDL